MKGWVRRVKRGFERASAELRRRRELRRDVRRVARYFGRTDFPPQAAQRDLDALGPDVADALLAQLKDEVGAQRLRWLLAAILIPGILATLRTGEMIPMLILSGFAWKLAFSRPQKRYAAALASVLDERALGSLARGMLSRDRYSRDASAAALHRTLPAVVRSDIEAMPPRDRASLYRLLQAPVTEETSDTIVALIDTLVRVGDCSAYPYLKRLAEERVDDTLKMRVWSAASQGAEALREGYERMQSAARLLRPAEAPGDETLLRPAHGTGPADADLLVHPAVPTKERDNAGTDTVGPAEEFQQPAAPPG